MYWVNRRQRRLAKKLGSTREQREVARYLKRVDWRIDLDVCRAVNGRDGKHFFPGRSAESIIKEAEEELANEG